MNGRGKRWTMKLQPNDLANALRRSVESAAKSGHLLFSGIASTEPLA
jgi:hypothetical protein